MTDPREPFETENAVEGTDLDDARFEERGTADASARAGLGLPQPHEHRALAEAVASLA